MSLHRQLSQRLSSQTRCRRFIHQSAIVQKKSKSLTSDDPFEDSDDLFGSAEDKAQPISVSSSSEYNANKTSGGLGAEARLIRFNELHAFVSNRIGQKPAVKTPVQVRNTAWTHLFGLATTREQLQSVTELFPKWRDSRRVFDDRRAAAFVRRCEELHCSDLALQVFCDHSKYGFPLTSLSVARHLMHSLHVEHPISSCVTLSALYKSYNIPPVSKDLVSTAMLASACFKDNTDNARIVAMALLPSLKELIDGTPPIPVPPKGTERSSLKSKETAWLARTLYKIEKVLDKEDIEYQWLRDWREKSGHLSLAA